MSSNHTTLQFLSDLNIKQNQEDGVSNIIQVAYLSILYLIVFIHVYHENNGICFCFFRT